ncbi:MAG: 23S rRNA (uracil(1939)-C(5))-methyltransferase RlmD [Traorella sp.]
MKKNDQFIGKCESYTYEGLGVVKYENTPVFVKNMLLNETGEIIITKVLKNYAFGRMLNMIEKSSERVQPKCSLSKQCGGCQLQHMSFNEQKAFKKQRVQDCITRIGKIDLEVEDIISMENPYHYRNKGQIPVGIKDDKVVTGFYRIHSNDIIDMNECLIQHDSINDIVQETKKLLQKYQNGEYFRHLLIKVGFVTQQIMIVFIVKDKKIPHLDEMIQILSKNEHVKSIILNINQRNDNVILGEEEIVLYGKKTIQDQLHDLTFNISSKSFFQVNPIQTLNLYDLAVEYAKLSGKETVLDLYCGIGTISLFMAQKAKHVIGIEIVEDAIKDAKVNAQINGIENTEFYCSDAGTFAKKLVQENLKPDVISIDPPRKGCDQITLDSIIQMDPKRIVYISCDPSTLARDLNYLTQYQYEVQKVTPVDMFPHSYHVETVVLMSKKNS